MDKPTLSYIYSRKSAERLFNKAIKRVHIYQNCILVVFEKGEGSPRFVSKAVFKRHFAEYRKAGSRQVYVSYNPLLGFFQAPSSHNIQDAYRIELYPDHLECSCKDWEVQEELGITKPTCKHCYAVLDYIGCQNLADYIQKDGMRFLDHNQQFQDVDERMRDWHDELMSCGY